MSKRQFLRHDRELAKEPLHYTQCGLDEIYLLNGFERKSTPHGEGVTISGLDGLHRRIGLSLITDRKTLTPKELRFLRKEMGLTQAQLGQDLRVSGQQVARWEKGECPVSGPAEVLLRVLYALELVPKREQPAFLNMLKAKIEEHSRNDEVHSTRLVFEETNKGWMKTLFNPPARIVDLIAM